MIQTNGIFIDKQSLVPGTLPVFTFYQYQKSNLVNWYAPFCISYQLHKDDELEKSFYDENDLNNLFEDETDVEEADGENEEDYGFNERKYK